MEINQLETSPKISSSSVFAKISQMGHEQVVYCNDEPTGLRAIIAIHNTILGPSLGGTRMWDYATEEEALLDVLRLSRGMTFKAAITGLNIGGGKAVIIGNAKTLKNEALLRRFGKFIDSLGGKYVTAEDVNMTTRDMEYISMETRYVTGLPQSKGGGGDPSPVTAYGTYMGMKAAVKKVYGTDSLEGKKIAVQGVGQVGTHLVSYLHKEKAQIYASDIFPEKVKQVVSKFKVTPVGEDELYDLPMDIYSPCALGATLNDESIKRLHCKIVAGGANNQLENEEKHGRLLMEEGIVYAPDFLINAGGVTNVYLEYLGIYSQEEAKKYAENIYGTTLSILEKSEKENLTPQEAATELALKRIEDIGRIKLSY